MGPFKTRHQYQKELFTITASQRGAMSCTYQNVLFVIVLLLKRVKHSSVACSCCCCIKRPTVSTISLYSILLFFSFHHGSTSDLCETQIYIPNEKLSIVVSNKYIWSTNGAPKALAIPFCQSADHQLSPPPPSFFYELY